MGYAIYEVGNRWAGYGVTATCEHPDCDKEIDRGMSFACGGEPRSEYGCDRYFCENHRTYTVFKDGKPSEDDEEDDCDDEAIACVCERCAKGEDEFDYKPEHPEWVYHLLNHYSWAEWRSKHPDTVAELTALPSRMPEHWSNDPNED